MHALSISPPPAMLLIWPVFSWSQEPNRQKSYKNIGSFMLFELL